MKRRVHNLLFALLLGAVLGATAYALHTRMPSLGTSFGLPREAQSKEKSKTERMIESGELSDHEAKYYKVIERNAQRRGIFRDEQ